MSIRLSLVPLDARFDGVHWGNDILNEDIDQWIIFGILKESIALDANRKIRARQDSDFENLRKIDPEHFDAITLPEDQRTVYRYDGIYINFASFTWGLNLYFVKPNYQGSWNWDDSEDYFRWDSFDGYQELFMDHNLLFLKEYEYGRNHWEINEEKIGKRFIIEYIYDSSGSEGRGGIARYKYKKVVSIKEL